MSMTIALGAHRALYTNAYDLSVFDYALWSTLQGHLAYVPFLGHSLFSHHFMPTLLGLLPIYALTPSPVALIIVQMSAIAVAAVLFQKLIPTSVPVLTQVALVAAFFCSRRSYSAFSSVFYIESLEPALIFGLLLAWQARKWALYWVLVTAALGCKEDMALYIGSFGALQWWDGQRKLGISTGIVAALWLAIAVGYAIPASRIGDGLPPTNPFVEARYSDVGSGGATVESAMARLASFQSLSKLVTLSSAVLFLCFAAPKWLLPSGVGLALDLAARGDTLQSGAGGHYLWPILPWLMYAAARGAAAAGNRWPRSTKAWSLLLLLFTLADFPGFRHVREAVRGLGASSGRSARAALARMPANASVEAMPNLVPHVPHRMSLSTLGRMGRYHFEADYIYLTTQGDLWPFTEADVLQQIAKIRADGHYSEVTRGALTTFIRKRPAASGVNSGVGVLQ